MYNLWWVVIGLGLAMVILIVLCIIITGKDFWSIGWSTISATGLDLLIGVTLIIVLIFAIYNPIIANNKYKEFLETKALVEQLSEGDYEQYENIGLNAKVIELNQWLVQAKANKKQYGNWSMYCNLDVENLDYIVLGGVQK